jgi:predicted small integral membrane protein
MLGEEGGKFPLSLLEKRKCPTTPPENAERVSVAGKHVLCLRFAFAFCVCVLPWGGGWVGREKGKIPCVTAEKPEMKKMLGHVP